MTGSAVTRFLRDTVGAGLILATALALVFQISFIVLGWGGENRERIANLANIAPNITSGLLILWMTRRLSGETRRAWTYIGLGIISYGLGNMVWAYIRIVLQGEPFPSLADAFYLLCPIGLIAGLLYFPRAALRQREALRLGLDVSIIIVAIGLLGWYTYLAGTVKTYGDRLIPLAISLAYPVFDLVLLCLMLLMTLGGRNQIVRRTLWLLVAGTAALIFSDTAFNILSATDGYAAGNIIDIGWGLAGPLFALAAFSSSTSGTATSEAQERADRGGRMWFTIYVPYLSVVLGYALLVMDPKTQQGLIRPGVVIGAGLILVLVIVRQGLAFTENSRLNRELRAFSGELERRVEERTVELAHANQELRELSEGLEHRVAERTAALIESQQQLVTVEKLAGLGRLTANLAHEINTPLAALMNNLYRSRELAAEYRDSIGAHGVTDDDHREIAGELLEAIHQADATGARIGEFIRRIRGHTREASSVLIDFDPSKVASNAMALLESQARTARVALQIRPAAAPINLHGESGRFAQVVNNLVANAIHACEGHGTRVDVRFRLEGDLMVMDVEDDGSGIPEDVLPRIFEPLFTTKDVGKGTGLGLSIIQDIVKGHFGGEIAVQTARGHGTIFSVRVPIRPSGATSLAAPVPVSASSPN